MSLSRHNSPPYKHIGHFVLAQSLELIWSLVKDPMSLYSFFLSFSTDKEPQSTYQYREHSAN